MNIRKIFRSLANFLVPTPATVRRHRAPSARFTTLEALAKIHGDTLTRDGRSYTLTTSDLRVLEFDNLAQVKSFLDLTASASSPGDADYVERPRNMYAPISGTVVPSMDIGPVPFVPDGKLVPMEDIGLPEKQPVPFVPVVATPITNDKVRE